MFTTRHRLITAAFIVIGLTVALPSRAALLGSITDGLTDPNASIVMQTITPSALTSLNTILSEDAKGLIIRSGSSLYFATAARGLRRQTIGGATATKVLTGTDFNVVARRGRYLVVGDERDNPKAQSFIYDLQRKTSTMFKPVIRKIIDAEFSQDAKVLALLAQDANKKTKLFLSQGNPTTVKGFNLPQSATACDDLALSPNGKYLAVHCDFGSAGSGLATVKINGQTLGSSSRKISPTLLQTAMTWLTDNQLMVGGSDQGGTDASLNPPKRFKLYTVQHTKVAKVETLAVDLSTIEPPGTTVAALFQLLRTANNQFLYVIESFGTSPSDGSTPFLVSAVGVYDVTARLNTVLLNDDRFNFLSESWVAT